MNNSNLKWTKEIPTTEGWYWVLYNNEKLVWFIDENGGVYNDYMMGNLCWKDDIEFYGPLEEPK